jgi:hypothetical protein
MGIRDEFVTVLRRNDATTMSFVINGTQFNGADFRRIAEAVEGRMTPNGRLYGFHVIVNPGLSNHTATRDWQGNILNPGIDAEYRSDTNTFTFSSNSLGNNSAKALAIHEAVHAIFDLNRTSLWAIDDEAAAYTAQCIFLLRQGIAPPSGMSPTFTAAFAAASSIQLGNGLTQALLQQLRAALQNNPNYRHVRNAGSAYLRNG